MESTEEYRAEEAKRPIGKVGAISNTHLRMLIDEITVTEINGKINLTIRLNADFRQHIGFYNDDGEMVDRVAECIAIPW